MRTRTSLGRRLAAGALVAATATAGTLVAAAPTASAQQPVAVVLDWGVKQSFRNYVQGPIAHGSVAVSDGAETIPTTLPGDTRPIFRFPGEGNGQIDGDAVSGGYGGTVRFLGHNGVLEIIVADPRVEVDGDTGVLVADVQSRPFGSLTEPGELVTYDDVELVSLNLTGITPTEVPDGLTFTGVPATLTTAGAPAFGGFYGAGTAFDPVTFTVVEAPAPPPPPPPAPANPLCVLLAGLLNPVLGLLGIPITC